MWGKRVPEHARRREHLVWRQRLWWMSAMQTAHREGIMTQQKNSLTSFVLSLCPTGLFQQTGSKNTQIIYKLNPDESLGATGLWTLLHVIWVGYVTNTNDNIVLQQIYMCKCDKCFNWELRFLLRFLACSRGKIVQLTREGLTNLRRVCLLTNILGGSTLREIPTEG